jgi:exosome complex exonuclease DIS3/RRP44
MFAYDPYVEETDDCREGIIHILEPGYQKAIIEDQEIDCIQNINRAFHLDKVFYKDNKIVSVNNDNRRQLISGILQISSKTIYGVTKQKVPLYLFRPTDWHFPNFYVPSKMKKQGTNVYMVISFHSWSINSKYPRGQIVKIIGNVGILENEYENILYKYNLPTSKLKDYVLNDSINNDVIRSDFRDLNVLSIDPPGCTDIDDAVHILELDSTVQIGIHIADVSHYIVENSDLDLLIRKRLTTVYAPHKQINMIPNNLGNNICSLKAGEDRFTFSIIFTLDSNGHILNTEFGKGIIHSNGALSYEQAQTHIENSVHDLHKLNNLCKKIRDHNQFTIDQNTDDAHSMIETLMVLANTTVATKLMECSNNSLLRIHEKSHTCSINDYNLPDNLKKYIRILSMNSAKYKIIEDKTIDTTHHGLNLQYYTHFTSPIRRYADIIVHRMLNNIINNTPSDLVPSEVINNMNNVNKVSKKAERDFKKIQLMTTIDEYEIVQAFIISIHEHKVGIYIPEHNLFEKVRLFSPKISMLTYINTDNSITITNNHTNNSYTLTLHQEITIKLVPIMESDLFNDKIKIEVVDPDPSIVI